MPRIHLIVAFAAAALLIGCGGQAKLSCDEVERYQLAGERQRLQVPEDLDNLDPMREMPLPEASPRPERPEGSPCLDMPPAVNMGD